MVGVPTQRPGDAAEPSLTVLRACRKAARALYRREAAAICDYVMSLGERTVVAREVVPDVSVVGLADDLTQHATCTAFVVAHLAPGVRPPGGSPGGIATERHYLGERTEHVRKTVLRDFLDQYRAASEVREAKDTGSLPNWYNTPLHLSGLAAALRDLDPSEARPADVDALGGEVAQVVAGWLIARGGFVPDIGKRDTSRNPYLTYWCVRSLTDWANIAEATVEVNQALSLALEANLDFTARILVANEAGIGSIYDASELVCSLGVVALASRWLRQRDEYVTAVLPHAVDVLLAAYVHNDGSFAPNDPVLEARGSRRVITASSEELNAILIHALQPDLLPRHLVRIRTAVGHASRKTSGPRGWGSSAGRSAERRSAFVAAGALGFLRAYRDALDTSIARLCAQELGVTPYVWDRALEQFSFPQAVGPYMQQRVIQPLIEGHRHLALTSLVLSGTRKVPKDLVARKIAYELEWPIVAFDPSYFVREDRSLESEVSRVLDLVHELSDTVVFLDRFDDTVEAFAQPALRWSMFGRLGRICDERRVLIVIDSARPGHIGLTHDRSGHFVNLLDVDPPNVEERTAVLVRCFDRYGADDSIRAAFTKADVAKHTHGFTDRFLHELVRACLVVQHNTGTIDTAAVERERQAMVQRLDTEEVRSHDRP